MKQTNKSIEELSYTSETTFCNNKPFKTLFNLYRGNYIKLFAAFLCFIVKHTPVWGVPIVTANVINIITEGGLGQMSKLMANVGVMLALVIINIPSHMLYIKYISSSVRQVESDIRMRLVKKLQIISIPYHRHLESGRLQAKVLRDVEAITSLSNQFCNTITPIILNLIVAFTITASKEPIIAIFFLVTVPIAFFIVRAFRKNIRRSNRDLRKNIEDMTSTVAQMVEMVPLTRAHGLEDIEIQKVDHKVQQVQKSGYQVDVLNAFFGSSSWALFQSLQMTCLIFTGYLAIKGKIQIGDIVLYQSYFNNVMNQVSAAINIYPEIVKGFESINSVGEIFEAEDVEQHQGKEKVKDVMGHYTFEHVTFKYDDGVDMVLEDFNLDVKEGECIAFVGESGGGKTTLLNLIIGFMKPTKGRVLLDEKDMAQLNLQEYRHHIAVVPQNTILFSGSIKDNITYGIQVSLEKLDEVLEAACLKEVIAKLPQGIETLVGEHGNILSGGQKQRIAIARALIREPKVIILDEATSALDNQSEIHVQEAMKNLIKGRTTFIVAHRLSTIVDADRIIMINGGHLIEGGSYEELMNLKGEFYKLAYSRMEREAVM